MQAVEARVFVYNYQSVDTNLHHLGSYDYSVNFFIPHNSREIYLVMLNTLRIALRASRVKHSGVTAPHKCQLESCHLFTRNPFISRINYCSIFPIF